MMDKFYGRKYTVVRFVKSMFDGSNNNGFLPSYFNNQTSFYQYDIFSKISVILALAIGVISVSAGGHYVDNEGIEYSCNTGPVQCCNSLQDAQNFDAIGIASLIGVAVSGLTGQVGLQCNPITGIGLGTGANCASSPVCCEENFQNQLVGINCTPITVGL
ncbi:fungal hydrophobin-domain-containing protein [Panaeolus papilionaceus]|nr:fungal hydrophobin-domain-containing protein [Panaeolus papilionaceus]